jgi:ATP-dependent DNA helicase RecG
MSDLYMKVKRVLELEQQKNYINAAVSGGLENFTSFLKNQIVDSSVSEKEMQSIITFFNSYQYLSRNERKEAIASILSTIETSVTDPFTKNLLNQSTRSEELSKGVIEGPVFQDPALYAGLQSINGVGPRNAQYFEKLGIQTIYDLLHFFPRKYQDFSQLKTINQIMYGEEVTLTGILLGELSNKQAKNSKLSISEGVLSDSTGTIKLTWFNQPFLKNQLKAGMPIVVSGTVDHFRGRLVMTSPVWEALDQEQIHTNRIVPIYPGTAGLSQRQIRKIINKNVNFWSARISEYLPKNILQENNFDEIGYAINQIHFPDSSEILEKIQYRFAFEEVFFLQLGTKFLKNYKLQEKSRSFQYDQNTLSERKKLLPYQLTGAQEKAIQSILEDMSSNLSMNRLLQGDVGSGKTVVSKFAIEAVVDQGAQAAVLVPTSILAEQHFRTISNLLIESGSIKFGEIALLLGKTTQKERKIILDRLVTGEIKCIIGTHALLEEDVIFNDLQLVIIDEQHRFGVNQRNTLKEKGKQPHTLVMSATPIPRSLAITLFGDLDITVMDEMPPGRIPVKTKILQNTKREKAYDLVREQIEKGFQAFIVYPLIEDDGDNEEKSAVANHQRIQKEIFPGFKVGLLHGKMKSQEKDDIMEKFRDKEFNILVSTTVIEVGVDIPGATTIIIESANFFGLAQLHQLRGRVGRNQNESVCLLIPDTDDKTENARLQAMVETNDGFKLADIDLALRGPGEFLGTRQSGYIGFEFASITDTKLIENSHSYVHNIISKDPTLSMTDHLLLKEELSNRWPGVIEKER